MLDCEKGKAQNAKCRKHKHIKHTYYNRKTTLQKQQQLLNVKSVKSLNTEKENPYHTTTTELYKIGNYNNILTKPSSRTALNKNQK